MSYQNNKPPSQTMELHSQVFAVRLLLTPECRERFLRHRRRRPEEYLAQLLVWDEDQIDEASPKDLVNALQAQLMGWEEALSDSPHSLLTKPLAPFAERLHLNEVETRILALAILIHGDKLILDLARMINFRSRIQLYALAASIIDAPESQVRSALAVRGRLYECGLLERDHQLQLDLDDLLKPAPHLTIELLTGDRSAEETLNMFARPAKAPELTLSDFDHYKSEVALISDLLKRASEQEAGGINILLYGPPGTGKTELARALVAGAGLNATESSDTDEDGDPLSPTSRLSQFLVTQRLMAVNGGGIVIFDEVEELLADEDGGMALFGRTPPRSGQKAFKTRILEENPVPAIWIGNGIHSIDPALLRRFSFTLHVDTPPRRKRRQLLNDAFHNLPVDAALLEKIADDDNLMPADITRTQRVLSIAGTGDSDDASGRLAMVISARPEGVRALPTSAESRIATLPYEPSWINAKPHVSELAPKMRRLGFGRVGLFGPPGTGKTAFARFLASELGVRCVVKKASDLLGPYVGQTEMQIAHAFREVRQESALLLIDEVDSLIQSRERAQRSWEITQVNELLTQIDTFDGYLVVASNFTERLDPALARRLDLKVQFDYLSQASLRAAFMAATKALGGSPKSAAAMIRQHGERLAGSVSLGDIACAMRQCQLRHASPSARDLLNALSEEAHARQTLNGGRAIGFMAPVH